jgi:hypothetical protein
MIVHGDVDTLVPVGASDRFWDALQVRRQRDRVAAAAAAAARASGDAAALGPASGALPPPPVDDVYVRLDGAHHAFNFLVSARTLAMGDAVGDWLENLYQHTMTQRRAAAAARAAAADGTDGRGGARPRL